MHRNEPAVMIFGAGFGTRMRELTKKTPKPLVRVDGKALIDHALDLAGQRRVVVNTHYFADQMQAHLARRDNVTLSPEIPDILETGGGLKHALPLLGADPVFTLNSDAIWAGPNPLDLLMKSWHPSQMDGLLMMVPIAQTEGYFRGGNFALEEDGQLTRSAQGMVYTGAQLIKTDVLSDFKKTAFSLNKLWDVLLDKGTLFGTVYPGKWADVGTPEGIAVAENMLKDNHV